jgi:hypothetical protein
MIKIKVFFTPYRWAQARVPLGQFNFPTRIRVECHPSIGASDAQQQMEGDSTLNVECSVDDLQLINCAGWILENILYQLSYKTLNWMINLGN